MRAQYMKQGEAFVLVFDITRRETFQEVESYIIQVYRVKDEEDTPIVLAANKIDRRVERQVTQEAIDNLSSNYGIPCLNTSAKNYVNVDETFHELCRLARKKSGYGNPQKKKKRRCTIL